jgi:hypothetical protein
MEREMCEYLEWELNVDSITLEQRVRGHNPQGLRPYPHPAIDEEVDTATHCPPPRCSVLCRGPSYGHRPSVLSIATQIGPPQNPSMAYMTSQLPLR